MKTYIFETRVHVRAVVTAETEAAAEAAATEILDALQIDRDFLSGYNSQQTGVQVEDVTTEPDESGPELVDGDDEDLTDDDEADA